MQNRVILAVWGLVLVAHASVAVEPPAVPGEYAALIPQRLLALLHAPQVHEELQLTGKQVADLEGVFVEVDGPWFRSRNLSPVEQRQVIDSLENRVRQWLAENLNDRQQSRLRQLEMQAQSVRMLLRPDLARELKLTAAQQRRFADLAIATDAAQATLQQAIMQGGASDEAKSAATKAASVEQDALKSVLQPAQHEQLWKALGEPFETDKLVRIYPMAPEFVEVEPWINSEPLTLQSLRGKVVLVHFYAFECHNCHANFEIYRRWHDELRERGVVVVGIQTPETSRERDSDAVRSAAIKNGLKFPIMMDLQSENWQAWGNTSWPTVYVVDKNGYLRLYWQGELNWQGATGDQAVEQAVETALAEPYPER